MTADEFRAILDRLHKALSDEETWVKERLIDDSGAPECYAELDSIWRDLNRHCALMKDAERQSETAVQPTRPLVPPPLLVRMEREERECQGNRP